MLFGELLEVLPEFEPPPELEFEPLPPESLFESELESLVSDGVTPAGCSRGVDGQPANPRAAARPIADMATTRDVLLILGLDSTDTPISFC